MKPSFFFCSFGPRKVFEETLDVLLENVFLQMFIKIHTNLRNITFGCLALFCKALDTFLMIRV